jgi:hypothetical protein
MANGTREVAVTWTFGKTGGAGLNTASTGAGTSYNTFNLGETFTFFVQSDAAATCSYQIRSGLQQAGPFAVLSSGTLSTSGLDLVQLPGPLGWLSPRIKSLNSTANTITIRAEAL